MRVLLASPFGKAGGIARWTEHILDHYSKVCYPYEGEVDYLPMILPHSQSVIHKGLWSRLKRGLLGYYKFCRTADKVLKTQKYDVLHFASSASISLTKDLCLIRIAHKRGAKAIVHFHFGRIPELSHSRNWEWKLLVKVIKAADQVVVIDKTSYDTLRAKGFDNISLLPNPVAPKVVGIVADATDVERKERTILFVGHGLRTKGIYELIDACRNIPNIRVKILGAILDRTKEELYQYSDKADWLDIVGEIPYEHVIKSMLECDVFVLPTYTEGFPNVILESMACGCAIVTTPVGAIPEMLEEEDGKHYGIMVEPRNVEQLKAGIEKMLSDADFKSECRANVQQRVIERYNIDSVWRQMVGVWNKTMAR